MKLGVLKENGHLPNTPTAEVVERSGLSLGDATVNQQVKIEEIYLHLFELNKEVKQLRVENEALRKALQKK